MHHFRIVKYLTGFSLLEILIVMAIIGSLLVLALPNFSSGHLSILRAQTRELRAVLNYVRRNAIVLGTTQVATIYQGSAENTSSNKKVPGNWVSRGVGLQWGGELVEGMQKSAHEISFYPEGGSSGGEIILTYEAHKMRLKINPLTGKTSAELIKDGE